MKFNQSHPCPGYTGRPFRAPRVLGAIQCLPVTPNKPEIGGVAARLRPKDCMHLSISSRCLPASGELRSATPAISASARIYGVIVPVGTIVKLLICGRNAPQMASGAARCGAPGDAFAAPRAGSRRPGRDQL